MNKDEYLKILQTKLGKFDLIKESTQRFIGEIKSDYEYYRTDNLVDRIHEPDLKNLQVMIFDNNILHIIIDTVDGFDNFALFNEQIRKKLGLPPCGEISVYPKDEDEYAFAAIKIIFKYYYDLDTKISVIRKNVIPKIETIFTHHKMKYKFHQINEFEAFLEIEKMLNEQNSVDIHVDCTQEESLNISLRVWGDFMCPMDSINGMINLIRGVLPLSEPDIEMGGKDDGMYITIKYQLKWDEDDNE
jgi:hypothetical protein